MNRRAGLGRGLGALLPGAEEARILDLPVDQIRPNRHQPRTEFSDEELNELAESIREVGLLQPVVVRQTESGYELLVGERRLRASKLAGVERIPALVRQADDRQALEQALVENLQRADLKPLEEALAYRNLVELFEITQEEVARRVGRSRVHITNTLRLLDLPDSVKDLLDAGLLTAGHARAILGIKDGTLQQAAARRTVDEGLTVRQIEAMARKAAEGADSANRAVKRQSTHPDLAEALSDRLSTVVRVEGGRGRGRIVISYGSSADLKRIADVILTGR
jgi:ParB family chromosome partitioning protein